MRLPEADALNKGFLWPAEDIEAVIAELCTLLPERFHDALAERLRREIIDLGENVKRRAPLPSHDAVKGLHYDWFRVFAASQQHADLAFSYVIRPRDIRFRLVDDTGDPYEEAPDAREATLLRWGL